MPNDSLKDLIKDLFDFIVLKVKQIISSRLAPLGIAFLLLMGLLVLNLFKLQIINGASAQDEYTQTTRREITTASTRGNIYDRNGVLLASNRMVYVCQISDTGAYTNGYEKNIVLRKLIKILEDHDEKLTTTVPIILKKGQFQYTVSDTALLRFLRDMYGLKSINDFTDSKPADTTAKEAFEYMKKHYGVGKYSGKAGDTYEITDKEALKIINIRFAMSMNGFMKYMPTEVASDISSETMQAILEHSTEMVGVEVAEDYVREYNKSQYMSSIVGYTGIASSDDLDTLNEAGGKYINGDVVGKIGIESTFETDLQGKKGEKVIYVDNEGHITSVESEVDPVPGKDIYLTVDSSLQQGIYHLIEQQLAAIILFKLVDRNVTITTDMTSGQRKIGINDVYFALIDNNILDTDHFYASDASSTEQRIYASYIAERDTVLKKLRTQLMDSAPAEYKDLPSDIQNYITYMYNVMKNNGILINDKIDITDETYIKYRLDESMSFRDFLKYCLSVSWIDTTLLDIENKYTSADETYKALVDLSLDLLKDDLDFDREVYNQMLHNGLINPCDVCLALFDQGVLKQDLVAIEALKNGTENTAYQFIRSKISTMELTPAMLALDPCTAAVTVVDSTTGDVLAMVSYPGYDNNKINDADYYYKVINDKSSPLYNVATQTRTAPGSTFKLVSTIAGLTEQVITTEQKFDCRHIFTKQGLQLNCTGTHHELNVTQAIQHSCNVFFSEVGYALSLDEQGEYHGTTGIANVQKYCNMVGLGTKSGVEIMEKEPHVSDENPIPSCIGQGTHAYANVHLVKYATTLATSGTVYELTLVDKLVDNSQQSVLENSATIVSTMDEVSQETWDVVHTGMYRVTHNGSHKKDFDTKLKLAGKTGTAEENKLRPNHATFIGYAPYDDPKWSFAVTIPFGYSSVYSGRLANSCMKFVEGKVSLRKIMESVAEAGSANFVEDDE